MTTKGCQIERSATFVVLVIKEHLVLVNQFLKDLKVTVIRLKVPKKKSLGITRLATTHGEMYGRGLSLAGSNGRRITRCIVNQL